MLTGPAAVLQPDTRSGGLRQAADMPLMVDRHLYTLCGGNLAQLTAIRAASPYFHPDSQ